MKLRLPSGTMSMEKQDAAGAEIEVRAGASSRSTGRQLLF